MDGLHKAKKQGIEEKKQRKKKAKHRMTDNKFDYGEDDEWVWGYGAKQGSTEYVINISGGGDGVSPNGFEDWVIKKVGGVLKYYIRHGGDIPDKEQTEKGFEKLFSCPEGNYVSFQATDYKPREGEMDFEWLEDELEETDYRFTTQIDNLERANKFLKNITEEQTKKIEDLQGQVGGLGEGYNAVKEEYEELKKENELLRSTDKKRKELHEKEIAEMKEMKDILEKVVRTEHASCYEGRMMLVKTLWEDEKDWRERIDLDFPLIKEGIEKLKATCDSLNNSGMETAHEYELLSDKTANDNETFIGVISDLESQVKKLESQVEKLESDKHNLMCVIREKNIDWKKVLAEMENDCRPDTWDCM